ncbi:MAG: SDR family NAD(P)-dependent oxidoreductase [Candidatus Nanopelagicales bacterium]
MSAPLAGRAAIVTGASAGLGAIMARGLAAAGCGVVVAARRADRLEGVAAEIAAAGGRAVAHPADLRDPGHAEALVDACMHAFGRVDGVVLNAAAATVAPAEAEDPAAFADVMQVNVAAQAALAAAAARAMIAAGEGGWMVLMSSILGRKAGTGPGVGAYVASKIAVEGLTRELARQWAPHGIRVNALAPGYFPTEMNAPMTADPGRRDVLLARTPMRRAGEPEDLVGPLLFLATDASRFVTGHTLPVDGGMSCW